MGKSYKKNYAQLSRSGLNRQNAHFNEIVFAVNCILPIEILGFFNSME